MAFSERISYLSANMPWFGGHTGYFRLLPEYVRREGADVRVFHPKRGIARRMCGKLFSLITSLPPRNQALTFAELCLMLRDRFQSEPGITHLLNFEEHCDLFLKLPQPVRRWFGTIHLPPSQWTDSMLGGLKHLSSAIMLYQRDIGNFERYVGKDRVRFVHYGVDTEFFRPGAGRIDAPPRVLYSGLYLRNTGMLARVIRKLHSAHPSLRFDLLVPLHARADPHLQSLREHRAVSWHAGLDDEQLLDLHRQSQLLLLPMNESGANTAVVEALACGLPIVTTDVGGIRDYGGGTLFPVVANNDDDAMVALVEQYLARPPWRDEVGIKCRRFAEETLAFPLTARRHLALYRELSA